MGRTSNLSVAHSLERSQIIRSTNTQKPFVISVRNTASWPQISAEVAAGRPSHPDGILMFMEALRMEGFSQADVDMMSQTNPALMLGLQ